MLQLKLCIPVLWTHALYGLWYCVWWRYLLTGIPESLARPSFGIHLNNGLMKAFWRYLCSTLILALLLLPMLGVAVRILYWNSFTTVWRLWCKRRKLKQPTFPVCGDVTEAENPELRIKLIRIWVFFKIWCVGLPLRLACLTKFNCHMGKVV